MIFMATNVIRNYRMNRRDALRTIGCFALLPTVELLKFPEQSGCAVCRSNNIEWFHYVSEDWEDVSYQCHDCGHCKCMVLRMN